MIFACKTNVCAVMLYFIVSPKHVPATAVLKGRYII